MAYLGNDFDPEIGSVPSVIKAGEKASIPADKQLVVEGLDVQGDLDIQGTLATVTGGSLSKTTMKTESIENSTNASNPVDFAVTPTVGGNPLETDLTGYATETYVDTATSDKVTLATVNSYDLGVGQTWQDVTASRSLGVTYTNTTGKPIFVSAISTLLVTTNDINITVDGSVIAKWLDGNDTNNSRGSVCAIVPNGSTYTITSLNAGVIGSWFELR